MKIDLEQIKVLLDMVSKTEIAELTIEVEGEKVTIKKPTGAVGSGSFAEVSPQNAVNMVHKEAPVIQNSANNSPVEKSANAANNGSADNLIAVTAPMVGTFYRAASPSASPYVEVGDKISVGQTVCIIEAMKLMNDLPSEVAGRVVKICADNGATVEYGQQLFLIDPAG